MTHWIQVPYHTVDEVLAKCNEVHAPKRPEFCCGRERPLWQVAVAAQISKQTEYCLIGRTPD